MIVSCLEPVEVLHTQARERRDTVGENKEDLAILPRIPNPIACVSSGDMFIFHLTINQTGTLFSVTES